MLWTVHFFDANNAPLTGLNVATLLAHFRDRTGAARPATPPVVELGGGAYGVVVPAADILEGVIGVFDGGASAEPRYQVRTASVDGLFAWHWLDQSGALLAGALTGHAFGLYDDPAGNAETPPAILPIVSPWLFAAVPSEADRLEGRALRITGPTDADPPFWTGTIAKQDSATPVAAVVSPPEGSSISSTTPLVIDVTDDLGLRRVIVAARFPDGTAELVHDGDLFSTRYASSSKTAISGGFRFTLRRQGGWFASPTIQVFPFDTSGNEG
jgi:hypothetical protein